MIISRHFEWMRPYLEEGIKLIPKGKKITRLHAWKFGGRCGKGEKAAIFTNDEKSYRIYIHHTYQARGCEPMPFSKIDLLDILAHELAHTAEIDAHTPDHKRLESKITQKFMGMLKKDGYVSEEAELEEKQPLK
jgi:hypothetical protein